MSILQGAACALILVLALSADGLMENLGPLGFTTVAVGTLVAAGLLIWLSTRPSKRKRKPPAGGGSSNGRRHQRKHWYITPPIMGDKKGFVKHG